MNVAVHRLMRLPRTRDLRTWFSSTRCTRCTGFRRSKTGSRPRAAFGGAFVLGIHSFAKLSETYGEEGAQNLASLARTKLILATADRDTAEHCSDYIGHREVRMMDEAYSYGYSNIRDAATITPRQQIEPLVIPDDIMKLPSLRGFLVFPEGFDAARVQLRYKDYPVVAQAYEPRQNVEPVAFVAADHEDGGEAGGRESENTPAILIENKHATPPLAPVPPLPVEDGQADIALLKPDRSPEPVEQTPERLAIEARTFRPDGVQSATDDKAAAGETGRGKDSAGSLRAASRLDNPDRPQPSRTGRGHGP